MEDLVKPNLLNVFVFRIFYVNQKTAKEEGTGQEYWRKCQKTLPRAHPVFNLYEYRIPEEIYRYYN